MFRIEDLNGVYKEIAECIDIETAVSIHKHFSGSQVTFPLKLFTNEYIYTQIYNEYDGTNLRKLSKKYGYSVRWIKTIIKEVSKKVSKEVYNENIKH